MSNPFYNPKNHYGNYTVIGGYNAPQEMIDEVKKVLEEQYKEFLPESAWGDVTWVVNPEYDVVDPDTGRVIETTAVGWTTPPTEG